MALDVVASILALAVISDLYMQYCNLWSTIEKAYVTSKNRAWLYDRSLDAL